MGAADLLAAQFSSGTLGALSFELAEEAHNITIIRFSIGHFVLPALSVREHQISAFLPKFKFECLNFLPGFLI